MNNYTKYIHNENSLVAIEFGFNYFMVGYEVLTYSRTIYFGFLKISWSKK